ncbi:MAG: glycosyltransferase [Turicibacter sp.]|nr:glycosyltransferase [Turicibacter sp.]
MIKVSIIIPCYNAERFMARCLESVINQTLRDIEIICVDDGSTDSTSSILRSFAAKDNRIQILTQKNQYAGVARNNGMDVATGKYLYFLDADDFISPHMLKAMYEQIEKDDADICYCGRTRVNLANGKISTHGLKRIKKLGFVPFSIQDFEDSIFQATTVVPWDKIIRADLAKKYKFDASRAHNDGFFARITTLAARKITAIDRFFVYHHVSSSTSLQNTLSGQDFHFYDVLKRLKQSLIEQDYYSFFELSFIKSVIGATIRYLSKLKSQEDYIKAADFVKNEIVPEFDLWNEKFYPLYSDVRYTKMFSIVNELYKRDGYVFSLYKNESNIKDPVLGLDIAGDSIKVSVIVPLVGECQYVLEAVQSALWQSLTNVEIICVIYENTNPETLAALKDYPVILEKSQDISVAKGEYIIFLQPTDLLLHYSLERLYRTAKFYDLDAVSTEAVQFYDTMDLLQHKIKQPVIAHFFKKEFLQKHEKSPTDTKHEMNEALYLQRITANIIQRELRKRDELAVLKQTNASLKDKNKALRENNAKLKGKNAQLKESNASIKDKNAVLKENNAKLKDKNTILREKNKLQKNRITHIESKLAYRVYRKISLLIRGGRRN